MLKRIGITAFLTALLACGAAFGADIHITLDEDNFVLSEGGPGNNVNDSEEVVANLLGLPESDVTQTFKVEQEGTDQWDDGDTSGTFSIEWDGVTTLIVLKADGYIAIFDITDDLAAAGAVAGDTLFLSWNTSCCDLPQGPFGLSHISGYSTNGETTVPEPATLLLLGLGMLGGYGVMRKRL